MNPDNVVTEPMEIEKINRVYQRPANNNHCVFQLQITD